MCIVRSAQTCISLIVELAILDSDLLQETPYIRVMPVNHRMHSDECRPSVVGGIEMCEVRSVRVRPACSDEDGLYLRLVPEVCCERLLHG